MKANALVKLGPFCHDQWKHIDEIHVLFPPLPSFGDSHIVQLYIASPAYLPYYQEIFNIFLDAVHEYDSPLKIFLYNPCEDYSNHFMLVLNQLVSEHLTVLHVWDVISIILDTELA